MTRTRSFVAALLVGTLAATTAVATGAPGPARAGAVWRVSVGLNGTQGNGDATIGGSIGISSGGRYVVFASTASNLVPGDTDGQADVFRHDRLTGRTQLVSVGLNGAPGHPLPVVCASGADNPSISANGRFVAFESCYDNLVAGDTNAFVDVFVRDMVTGVTTRASLGAKAAQANGSSDNPAISADGRSVAFTSAATNLDPKTCDTSVESQVMCGSPVGGVLRVPWLVFVRDLSASKTTIVSLTPTGHLPDGSSNFASLSPTGRYVAYTSTSDDLTAGDANNQCIAEFGAAAPSCDDVFLYDRQTRRTELISVGIDGNSSSGGADTPGSTQLISTDGRYVAFQSGSSNLVPNSHNYGVYLRDRRTHRTTKVSVFSDGREMPDGDGFLMVTADGRFVVMDDAGTLPDCSPQPYAIARYDTHDASMEVEDRTDPTGHDVGCTYYGSGNPAVTPDGRYVAFVSGSSGLVRGDTNGKTDVFVRDRGPATGVGGLAGSKAVSPGGSAGTGLIGAQVHYRPQLHDLFVRLQVARMPLFAVASPAVVYALDFTAGGHRYEVRAAKTGPTAASFGLFEQSPTGWMFVTALTGGYGTTGQDVVAAVPARFVPAASSSLSQVAAITGLGSFFTGITTIGDTLRLT